MYPLGNEHSYYLAVSAVFAIHLFPVDNFVLFLLISYYFSLYFLILFNCEDRK